MNFKAVALYVVLALFTATGSTYASQTLTLALMSGHFNDGVRAWMEDVALPVFYERHPGVQVEVRYTPGDAAEHLTLWHATGTAPDVFSDSTAGAGRFRMSLERHIAHWSGRTDVVPTLLQAGIIDGHHTNVPWSLNVRHIYFWKDRFEESGLDAGSPPVVWVGLLGAVRQLIRYDGSGAILQYPILGADQWMFESLYYQAGGTPLGVVQADDDWPERQPTLDVFEYMQELYHAAYPQGGPARFGVGANPNFLNRTAVIFYNQSNVLEAPLRDPEVVGHLGAFPAFARTAESRQVSVANSVGLSVSEASQNPELAWELVAFLMEPEIAAQYNQLMGRVPTLIPVLTGAFPVDFPLVHLVGPIIEHTIQSFLTSFSGLAPINNLINARVEAILAGQQSPPSAAEEFIGQIRALQAAAIN